MTEQRKEEEETVSTNSNVNGPEFVSLEQCVPVAEHKSIRIYTDEGRKNTRRNDLHPLYSRYQCTIARKGKIRLYFAMKLLYIPIAILSGSHHFSDFRSSNRKKRRTS